VIHRALVHVAGPPGVGKTTLIERLLESELAFATCIRAELDPRLRHEEESAPKRHPELRRYREKGAGAVALYRFPRPDSEAFYCSSVMEEYSEAIFIEGDCPLDFVDLSVFVAPAPEGGDSLLRRVPRDHAAEHRASLDRYAAAFATRETLARYLAEELGKPMATLALRRPELLDELGASMKRGLDKVRQAPPPAPTEHWALSERYQGLAGAQLVIVNLYGEDDRARAEKLCREIHRVRKDPPVFEDVIGVCGNRVPITAVVTNLENPQDPGWRKCSSRVRRCLRSVSDWGLS
jgi:hypothetical protein